MKLHIQINPKGRVVRVTRADSNIPEYVVESAEKSIKGWRFEPPGDLGIEAVIGKTFTIDVVTEAWSFYHLKFLYRLHSGAFFCGHHFFNF